MKRVLFKKILIAYLILAPVLLISLELYLSSEIRENYLNNLKKNLIIQARLIAEEIPSSFDGNLDNFCRHFKAVTGSRVTIIDASGKVLGDSDEPSEKMENHSNRPEIKEADAGGTGSSVRLSRTLRLEQFYLAVSVDTEPQKFLRLALPLHDVNNAVNQIRLRIIAASLSVSLIALLVGLYRTRKVTKAIEEIADFSREVAEGNFKRRLFLKEKDELGLLGMNISNMAEELQTRLNQSENEKKKIEAIIFNLSDGLILTDINGRIILSNESIRNLFGIASVIEGKTLMEAFRKAELMDLTDSVVENRQKISFEIDISHPKELYMMVTASPFSTHESAGALSGVVLTFHDITRLKKLEEVRKDFVANVSHEIRTPITAIKGFAETLLEGALEDTENARKFIGTIKENSERLNSLVNDLLMLSRIELGDIKIEKTKVDPEKATETVFAVLRSKAEAKGLYLKKEISPEIRHIEADEDRLVQILINLVDNGIKFTEKGGVTIKIQNSKFKIQDEEKECAEISVIDTGSGIPQKFLSRLGERFYRVDRARSRELGGTGLGLAIVKHIVKAHGWEMRIESREGQGTAVHIILPLT